MKANMKRTKDVIVSMEPSKHRKVYHRPGCIYVERIKPQNKMIISKKQAQKYRYQSCKLTKVLENPQVIKTPVVRNGKQSTLGYQPNVWKSWK